jgi:hypothetical protein
MREEGEGSVSIISFSATTTEGAGFMRCLTDGEHPASSRGKLSFWMISHEWIFENFLVIIRFKYT